MYFQWTIFMETHDKVDNSSHTCLIPWCILFMYIWHQSILYGFNHAGNVLYYPYKSNVFLISIGKLQIINQVC